MSTTATPSISARNQSRLDRAAIFLAVLCGIHCLATPVILVVLPLLANTVWVSEHFHLGMLLLVFPTSLLAAFAGCRRHRDRLVIGFIVAGLAVLSVVTGLEVIDQWSMAGSGTVETGGSPAVAVHENGVGCNGCCPVELGGDSAVAVTSLSSLWNSGALLNSLGGLFLVLGHARNFLLCRRHRCDHSCG